MDFPLQGAGQHRRVPGGADANAKIEIPHPLPVWHIEKAAGRFVERPVFAILRDPDDCHHPPAILEGAPDRVLPRPEAFRHGLVDNGGARRILVVVLGEVASGNQRDLHHRKIPRRDDAERESGVLTRLAQVAIDFDPMRGTALETEGEPTAERGGLHPRDFRQALLQPAIEDLGSRLGVAVHADPQAGHQDVIGIEAKARPARLAHTPDAQPGSDQQHERKGDFGNHQHAPEPMLRRGGAGAVSSLLERGVEIGLGGLESRRKPEDDSGGQRKQQVEAEGLRVHPHGDAHRQVGPLIQAASRSTAQ